MSVLVKNMDMPDCCNNCEFHWEEDVSFEIMHQCQVKTGYIDDADIHSFPYDCPLVELPEKHGDLIDRNDLKKEYAMGFDCNNCVSNWKSCQYDAFYAKMDFCLMLDDAPVVIEAEGK